MDRMIRLSCSEMNREEREGQREREREGGGEKHDSSQTDPSV
jgi:hypothetical protein